MAKKKPEDFKPKKDFPKGHKHYGKPRCQKWSYRKGRQCLGLAMRGKDSCRVHGGKSLKGIAHPRYKTGKYSELPDDLLVYQDLRNNPDYLKLQDEIALIDARLVQLTSNLNGDSSSEIFNQLVSTAKRIENAQAAIIRSQNIQDEEEREKVRIESNQIFLSNVSEIIKQVKVGAKEWYVWDDITSLIEQRRRLVDTERKLLVDTQNLINVQDVMIILDAVMESVRRNVTDQATRQRIQSDYLRYTAR